MVVRDHENNDIKTKSRINYTINYLSENLAGLVAQITTKKTLATLRDTNFDYITSENVMRLGLFRRWNFAIWNQEYTYDSWEIYRNVKSGNELKQGDLLQGMERPIVDLCEKKILFDSMYLECNVTNLPTNTLPVSRKHNVDLFEALTVNHDKKQINMFQLSASTPNQHKLEYRTIERVMEGFKLFDNSNMEYRINYFYCVRKSSFPSGCEITGEEKISEILASDIKNRFKIYICRIHYFPEAEDVVLLKA